MSMKSDSMERVCAVWRRRRLWFPLRKDGHPDLRAGSGVAWIGTFVARDYPPGTYLAVTFTAVVPDE